MKTTRWVRYRHQDVEAFGTLEGETVVEHAGSLFGHNSPSGRTHALRVHPEEDQFAARDLIDFPEDD